MSACCVNTPSQIRTWICAVILFCAVGERSQAQTFTKLLEFDSTSGQYPETPLAQGLDGNFYGTTAGSGVYGQGTFFTMTAAGTLTPLYNFCRSNVTGCPDGAVPTGPIALGPDGNFYGATAGSPATGLGYGTLYRMTPGVGVTTLHNFCSLPECRDGGQFTLSGVTLAQNGSFYGIAGSSPHDWGRVFHLNSTGSYTILKVICPDRVCPTNAGPSATPLLQASGGYLVGHGLGGASNASAIYRMTPHGDSTIVYSFCDYGGSCHDPIGDSTSELIQTPGGNFVGVSTYGGAGFYCKDTSNSSCGTAFRVNGNGTLTRLHDFCNWADCQDGSNPAAILQATDGNFYGVSTFGGNRGGTIFKLTAGGVFSVLYSFSGPDGFSPTTLMQATDGNLYGTTFFGGANGGGVAFSLTMGLALFVKTVQSAGKAGDSIIILGNNLGLATNVTFNGVAATFSNLSGTEITATVPAGASSGKIQVVAPAATLSSNVAFTVLH
jgi:uncharacterized repeat protein (TIGR03803 family)